jgi:hypothetical protein
MGFVSHARFRFTPQNARSGEARMMFCALTLQEWSNVAVIVAGTSAAAALGINAFQLKLNRDFQKQVATKATYREYLKLAVKHPLFGDGNFKMEDKVEQSRYEWFVSFFLLAAEEVLEYAWRDTAWVEAVKEEIERHTDYLADKYFSETEIYFYSERLQQTVRQIISARKVTV